MLIEKYIVNIADSFHFDSFVLNKRKLTGIIIKLIINMIDYLILIDSNALMPLQNS